MSARSTHLSAPPRGRIRRLSGTALGCCCLFLCTTTLAPTALAGPATAHAAGRLASRSSPAKPSPHRKARRRALHGDGLRAELAFEAMQKYDYIEGSGLYSGEPFSSLWSYGQAFAATVTLATVPGMQTALAGEIKARLVGLASYLDSDNSGEPEGSFTSTLPAYDGTVAPPTGPGGTKYYDDNDWVGIELARVAQVTHNAAALASAEQIMAFEMAGWESNPALACPGGIPFSNSLEDTTRNTVTNGPTVELAVVLYRLTGNQQYLQFAVMDYEWVERCLHASNGLFADSISRQGSLEPAYWSYNQGVMVGAGVLLYQATGDSAYLYQSRQLAKAALAYFTPSRLAEENPFFVAVYMRNMLYLDSITHDPPGRPLAQRYVDSAWQHLRRAHYLFVWGFPPAAQLLYQASIAQIYGLLASSPSTYF